VKYAGGNTTLPCILEFPAFRHHTRPASNAEKRRRKEGRKRRREEKSEKERGKEENEDAHFGQ
jgi:hypothetical protein